jgi:hypothetical protein
VTVIAKSLLALSLLAVFARADTCRQSVALLGTESESREESTRESVLSQIAALYGLAINDQAPMQAAYDLIQELAEREGKPFGAILREVELMETSPSERVAREEERRAILAEEQSRLLEGLEPYLSRIGRDHRRVIEETLIRPGLVNPVSTGEIEFEFQGKHSFVIREEFIGVQKKQAFFGLKDSFAIGQVPVTQLLYFLAALGVKRVNPTPSAFQGDGAIVLRLGDNYYTLKPNHPVDDVSWHQAKKHADRVSRLMGVRYALPNVLQWEFANRAGGEGLFHFGDEVSLLPKYAWFKDNSGQETHEVAELLPNGFHLYDTHGNVAEWTSTSAGGGEHIARGGGALFGVETQTSSYHIRHMSQYSGVHGLRLIRLGEGKQLPAFRFTLGEPEPAASPSTGLRAFYQGLLNRMRFFRRSGK